MKNALTYITKACPRDCTYCGIATKTPLPSELDVKGWKEAFAILHSIGVTFNLILGNEAWLLGDSLLDIMDANKVPYAMYTTAPPKLFTKYSDRFFTGPIDNLSCGIDYPFSHLLQRTHETQRMNDMERKSLDGWMALIMTRFKYPHVDTQGMYTIHRRNYRLLPAAVREFKRFGIFVGLNFIHYDKDGRFDFFPNKEHLKDFLFNTTEDRDALYQVLQETLGIKGHIIQQPEVYTFDRKHLDDLLDMNWHCGGDPYGGPTIESDGSLRCCGYRKGEYTSMLNIFDLPRHSGIWRDAVREDALDCPGCSWSYPRMFHYWLRNPEFARKVFTKHAGKHIPPEQWSNRKVE